MPTIRYFHLHLCLIGWRGQNQTAVHLGSAHHGIRELLRISAATVTFDACLLMPLFSVNGASGRAPMAGASCIVNVRSAHLLA